MREGFVDERKLREEFTAEDRLKAHILFEGSRKLFITQLFIFFQVTKNVLYQRAVRGDS